MQIIIAEKAIAGKRIAQILSDEKSKEKTEGGAKIFEFEKGGETQIVVPLRGHVTGVDFPKKYSHWVGTDLRKLVSAEVEYVETEKQIIAALKKLAKKAEKVTIATDDDREGEAIGAEALRMMKETNQNIEADRARFSAITPKDISKAFANLEKVNLKLAEAANTRREIDLIWGAVITRFLSLISGRLGQEFLSAGRVQSPCLALIVDRERERLAFVSKKYWVISAIFVKGSETFLATHEEGKFWEKAKAEAVIKKDGKQGKVAEVAETTRTLARPTPFNTTAFLRAATAIGFSAGEAMNIAEHLYQEGYTSYPRTDNCVYPASLDLNEILMQLHGLKEFQPLVDKIFKLGKLEPSSGKETKDHPPIHPVSAAKSGKLSDRQWRIYELIVRRFLATLGEDAMTANTRVKIDLNAEIFVANGQRIVKNGWKEFYPYSELNEIILPKLAKGDLLEVKKLNFEEKQTEPPARYSQGALIKLMEDLGLGTKATRHEILQKLLARKYIIGLQSLEPNKIAFSVINTLEKYSPDLTKPIMTAKLEQDMDLIATAAKQKSEVVQESREFLGAILDELLKNKDQIGTGLRTALREDSIVAKCDKCPGQLRMIWSKNRKRFLGCTGYPKCTNTHPLPQKGRIVPIDGQCEHCKKAMIKIIGKRYRYEMCVDINCVSKKEWKQKKEAAQQKAAKEEVEA